MHFSRTNHQGYAVASNHASRNRTEGFHVALVAPPNGMEYLSTAYSEFEAVRSDEPLTVVPQSILNDVVMILSAPDQEASAEFLSELVRYRDKA